MHDELVSPSWKLLCLCGEQNNLVNCSTFHFHRRSFCKNCKALSTKRTTLQGTLLLCQQISTLLSTSHCINTNDASEESCRGEARRLMAAFMFHVVGNEKVGPPRRLARLVSDLLFSSTSFLRGYFDPGRLCAFDGQQNRSARENEVFTNSGCYCARRESVGTSKMSRPQTPLIHTSMNRTNRGSPSSQNGCPNQLRRSELH